MIGRSRIPYLKAYRGLIRSGITTEENVFEQRSGVHVTLPLAGIRDLSSPGASGVYTPQQAIGQLLKDTGVVYRFTGQKAVTVEPDRVLASVGVNAHYSAVSPSMPKYTQPLTDTPQTISVVPQSVIEEQNVAAQCRRHQYGGGRTRIAG